MKAFLHDSLPMDEWRRRRTLQLVGRAPSAGVLSDDLAMADWQALRNRQADGASLVVGGEGVERLTGDSEQDRLAAQRAAGARPARIDPSRTEVFRRGPDGKLHPIAGWHTTGPFAFGEWARNVDWRGVGDDLATIGAGAVSGAGASVFSPLELAKLVGSLYTMGKEAWQAGDEAAGRGASR